MNQVDNKLDDNFISTVAKKIGISQKKIYDLLFMLKSGESINNTTLLQGLGVSKNVLNKTKKALSSILQPPSTFTKLRDTSIKTVNNAFPKDYQLEDNLLKELNKVI